MLKQVFPRPPYDLDGIAGATIVYWDTEPVQQCELNDDVAFTFVDPPHPCALHLIVLQDGTGGWTIDWSAVTLSGPEPVISATPSTVTVINLFWDGTSYNV